MSAQLTCAALAGCVVLLAGCATGSQSTGAEGHTMEVAPTRSSPWCVGRFAFTLPQEVTLAGRAQRIYRMEVSTHPIEASAADSVWNERLAHARASRPPPGATNSILKELELPGGVRALWYLHEPRLRGLRMLEAVRRFDDHVLLLARGGAEGKEAIVEQLVGNVAAAYVPGSTQGFCVGAGAITPLMSADEDVRATFVLEGQQHFELKLSTSTVATGATPDAQPEAGDEAPQLAAAGGELRLLHKTTRVAAGLEGVETLVELRATDGALLQYSWFFEGVGGRGDQPKVRITATGDAEAGRRLRSAWESMLTSLRPSSPRKE